MGLQEKNASLIAAVALADAEIEVIIPTMNRTVAVYNATSRGFGNFSSSWEAGVAAATSAETELASLTVTAEEYASSANATVEGASLPSMIKILQTNVAALKSESAAKETALLDATADLALRQQDVIVDRHDALAVIYRGREANATELTEVQGKLTDAWADLESARVATDAANNCTVSFGALERNVLKVAVAALRPVTGATELKIEAMKREARLLRGP